MKAVFSLLTIVAMLSTSIAQAAYVQTPYPVTAGGTGSQTAPSAGQILVGNAGGTAYAPVSASGDFTIASTGVATISAAAVTLAKMANLAAHSYIGNNTGSSATPIAVTSTQLTADLNLFGASLQGLVPASGGGTTNFLRADGTFAVPAGSSYSAGTGLTLTGSVFSITSPISIALGGTNSVVALNNNRFMVSSAGSIVEASAVTASSALASDTNGLPVASATTATELGYVHNVTSAIQTQLNAKEPLFLSVTDGGNAAYAIRSAPLDLHVRDTTTLTGNQTYTLPVCNASNIGERHEVKNLPAQTFNIILAANGADTIDGVSSVTVGPGDSIPVVCSAFSASGTWDIE